MALFGLLGGKKTSVGLDIGSGIIKLAVIDHSGSEPELIKVATTEVAADAIVEGEVMDPGLVSEAIRGLFSTAGVKQRTVVTAVGGRDVIVKKIQMDRMKEGDAREVIRWEAEQHVPFDMANVELDFQILDPDAEGLQMNVLLVAAKRELVDSRTSLLGEAGLEAGIIDGDAAIPGRSAAREGALGGGLGASHPGPGAERGPGAVRGCPGRGDRGGGGAGGGVPRDGVALCGGPGARVHHRRRGARAGSERGVVEPAAGAGGAREPGAAAQGARFGIRVRRGG